MMVLQVGKFELDKKRNAKELGINRSDGF